MSLRAAASQASAAAGFGVLRHHLYDLDRNKSYCVFYQLDNPHCRYKLPKWIEIDQKNPVATLNVSLQSVLVWRPFSASLLLPLSPDLLLAARHLPLLPAHAARLRGRRQPHPLPLPRPPLLDGGAVLQEATGDARATTHQEAAKVRGRNSHCRKT